MLEELLTAVKEKSKAIAESMGYEIVEVNFSKEYRKLNLNFFIYKKGGVDLNDCENFSNALDSLLEELADKFPSDYVLNVSSPGLDRPIVSDDDFRRALDTEIEVFINGDKKEAVRGKLKAYDTEKITVSENKKGQIKEINILRQNIRKAQPWIKF
ncbi:ribosome maturation factor RimP [Acidaminococcus sp. CAG:917]|nr:ribosome maturation factor RimP [Acidaminococcus sp. CAG:917]